MGAFRDYQRVIQTGAHCCEARPCPAIRGEPWPLYEAFRTLVEQTWNPAEIDRLHEAARSALL